MKSILSVIFLLNGLFASNIINKDNTWGCISENKSSEMNNAIINKDKKAIDYLINYEYCFLLKKGQEVTVINSDSYDTLIRIYPKNKRPVEISVDSLWITKSIDISTTKSETHNNGETLFKATCALCHGEKAEKKALGKSQVIAGWDKQKLINALNGYKNRTYGGVMRGVMTGQIANKTDTEIELVSEYISSL
jgi:cytochrome c553